MIDGIQFRSPRTFKVYKSTRPVANITGRPGVLTSMAPSPPPGSDWRPPLHPFLSAQSLHPSYEGMLVSILEEAVDFDDYLKRLVAAGFDIASPTLKSYPNHAYRLSDSQGLLGAAWDCPGQFTTLEQQPSPKLLTFRFAMLTAYRTGSAEMLLEGLQSSRSFPSWRNLLQKSAIQLHEQAE